MKITILGAGAYGIALAKVLNENQNEVIMWTKYSDEKDSLLLTRENKKVLPGIIIDENITITDDLENCVLSSKVIVIAVPMNAVRQVAKSIAGYIKQEHIICIVTKGIETGTGKRMSEVVKEETGSENICMLSGPSFAIDLANDNYLGPVASSSNISICGDIKEAFENDKVTVKVSEDIIGVEICASVKNVFAIVMGMLNEESESTKATMLTNLLNDLRLICEVLGGKSSTIFTYAGIGDFLLTCMNLKSRNYTFGTLIAKGLDKDKVFETMGITTVEGLYSLDSIHSSLSDRKIDINSVNTLYNILYNGLDKGEILNCLK